VSMILTKLKDILFARFQSKQLVEPALTNEVVVTGAAGAWTYGSYADLDASTANARQIIGVNVVAISAGSHQIDIATGTAGSEVVQATLQVDAVGFYQVSITDTQKGVRVAARTASKAGSAQTVSLKYTYVEL
jgi:hypothetical protein